MRIGSPESMLPLRCKLNAGNRDLAEAVRWPAHAPELQRFRFQLAMDDKRCKDCTRPYDPPDSANKWYTRFI